MIICRNQRYTSQGPTTCDRPETHTATGSDHIAILTDEDGQKWIASWTDRHLGAVDMRTQPLWVTA